MLAPFIFEPVYKQIIWGGDRIASHFHRRIPFEKVAESWEITCREDGMSVTADGRRRGRTLAQLIDEYGERLLGNRSVKQYGRDFPLLIKIIDAGDRLSVQVHPDDAYARAHGERFGKNEMWYVIDARPGARLVFGLREGVTKERFAQAVREGTVAQTLCEVPVKRGDSFFIRAGTVHAILDGILIAEIQQNSNTTYRIYDWDRVGKDGKPRELHVGPALDVIRFDASAPGSAVSALRREGGAQIRPLVESPFFHTDEVKVNGCYESATDGSSFVAVNTLEGEGTLRYDGGETPLRAGTSLLLPACLGRYTVSGTLTLLESGV